MLPKRCVEDSYFTTTNQAGEPVPVYIPKGSPVVFPIAGLHYNGKYTEHPRQREKPHSFPHSERYWDDPHEFWPDRFLSDWPRNAFLSFSSGKSFLFSTYLAWRLILVWRSASVLREKVPVIFTTRPPRRRLTSQLPGFLRRKASLSLRPFCRSIKCRSRKSPSMPAKLSRSGRQGF